MLPKKIRKKVTKLYNADDLDGILSFLDKKWPSDGEATTNSEPDENGKKGKKDKKKKKKKGKGDAGEALGSFPDTLEGSGEITPQYSAGDMVLAKHGNGRPKKAEVLARGKSGKYKVKFSKSGEEAIIEPSAITGTPAS